MAAGRDGLAALEVQLLEEQLFFARVQFDVLSQASPAHKVFNVAARHARLQARIDELEAELISVRRGASEQVEWSEQAIDRIVHWTYPGVDAAVGPAAVLVADADSHYIDASPAGVALLGYSVEELRQRTVADVVAWDREWTADEWARYRADGEWTGAVELRRKDGTIVKVRSHAKTIKTRSGTVYLSVLTPDWDKT